LKRWATSGFSNFAKLSWQPHILTFNVCQWDNPMEGEIAFAAIFRVMKGANLLYIRSNILRCQMPEVSAMLSSKCSRPKEIKCNDS
jgi:hypothetical protein